MALQYPFYNPPSPAPTLNDNNLLEHIPFLHLPFAVFCSLAGVAITVVNLMSCFMYCCNEENGRNVCETKNSYTEAGNYLGMVGAAVLSVYTAIQLMKLDYGYEEQDAELATGILYSAAVASLYFFAIPLTARLAIGSIGKYLCGTEENRNTVARPSAAPMLSSFNRANQTSKKPTIEITEIEEPGSEKPSNIVARV
jgi:hypothetical protein